MSSALNSILDQFCGGTFFRTEHLHVVKQCPVTVIPSRLTELHPCFWNSFSEFKFNIFFIEFIIFWLQSFQDFAVDFGLEFERIKFDIWSSGPIKFQLIVSRIEGDLLPDAWVSVWSQFRYPAGTHDWIVNISFSNFNLGAWFPASNFAGKVSYIPSTPTGSAFILFKASIDYQVFAPAINALILTNCQIWYGDFMIWFFWTSYCTELYCLLSLADVCWHFKSLSTFTWQKSWNRPSIKIDN